MNYPTSNFRFVFLALTAGLMVATTITPLIAQDVDEDAPRYKYACELKDIHFSRARIASLINELSGGGRTQSAAIYELSMLGPESRSAIPKLIELITEESFDGIDNTIGMRASRTLRDIGVETIGPLDTGFNTLSQEAQSQAVVIFRRIGVRAKAVLPRLIKLYGAEKDESKRCNLLTAIAATDPTGDAAFPILIDALEHGASEWERSEAATWLTRTDVLIGVYWKEEAPGNRWFRRSPQNIKIAGDALVLALDDKSSEVHGRAALSLSSYPETAKRAVPKLLKLLEGDETYSVDYPTHVFNGASVSRAASQALRSMHSEADQILSHLRPPTAIYNGSDELFYTLTTHTKQPLDQLLPLLIGDQVERAMAEIVSLGNSARPAIPRLESLLKQANSKTVILAHFALVCIDPKGHPDSVAAIKHLPSEEQANVREFLKLTGQRTDLANILKDENAVIKLPENLDEGYGSDDDEKIDERFQLGPSAIPHLIKALQTPMKSPRHRIICIKVLGRFKNQAAAAVPAISEQLKSEFPRVREAAANALGAIASNSDISLPALRKSIYDLRPFVRAAAVKSCAAFGPAAASVVPSLVKRLSDPYLDVRLASITALGKLGAVAKEGIPQLEELKDSDNLLLRDTARDAIAKIQQN